MSGEGSGGGPSGLVAAARDFLSYVQVERGASANTVDSYRRTLRRYLTFLAERGITEPGEATQEALLEFATHLRDPKGADLGPRSTAQAFSALRMFHRFMVTEGYCRTDPTGVLAAPRLPGRLPRALTREQVESLLDAPAGDTEKVLRDRMILELLYASGLRISELVALNVSDLDLDERILRVRGKGNRWRIAPFGATAGDAVARYLQDARPRLARGKTTAALVLNTRGGRLTRQGCWKIIRGYSEAVGLGEVMTPHVLRHSFATHLLEGGANLVVVQELLGHASVSTTQIYTKVTPGHLSEAYRRYHPRA